MASRAARSKAGLTKVAEVIGATVGKLVAKADSAASALNGEIKRRASRVSTAKGVRKAKKAAKRVRKNLGRRVRKSVGR